MPDSESISEPDTQTAAQAGESVAPFRKLRMASDTLVASIFTEPETVAMHLQRYLPPELVALLDLRPEAIKPRLNKFASPGLRRSEADMVFEVPFKEEIYKELLAENPDLPRPRAKIYILLEAQSTDYAYMAARCLGYISDVIRADLRDSPGEPPSAVVSMVLTHGISEGKTPSEFGTTTFKLSGRFAQVLGQFIPKFRLLVLNLAAMSKDELGGTELGRSLLLALKTEHDEVVDGLPDADLLKALDSEVLATCHPYYVKQIFTFILNNPRLDRAAFHARVEAFQSTQTKDHAMSILDTIRQESLQEGRQEGRQEGLQEGRQEGELIGFIHAAQLRYGEPLTPRETLLGKTLDQLRAMLKQIWPEALVFAR